MRIKKGVIFVLFLFFAVLCVHALNSDFIFNKTYSTKEQLSAYEAQYSRMYKFNDGILHLSYEGNIDDDIYDEYKITYTDNEGNVKKSLILGDYIVYRICTDGTDIYYFWRNSVDNKFGMTVLNSNFTEIGTVIFSDQDYYFAGGSKLYSGYNRGIYNVNKEFRYEGDGFETVVRDGDYIYYYYSGYNILKIDGDYNYTIISDEDELVKLKENYFPLIKQMEDDNPSYGYYYYSLYSAIDNERILSAGSIFQAGASLTNGYIAAMKMTNNDNVQWEITNPDYIAFSNIKIINEYIVAIADKEANGEYANERSDILVYSMDGKLIQKISNDSKFVSLLSLGDGFLVNRFYTEGACGTNTGILSSTTGGRWYTTSDEWDTGKCKTFYYTEKYALNKEDDSVVENPNTKVGSIVLFICIGIVALVIIGINVKKIKKVL